MRLRVLLARALLQMLWDHVVDDQGSFQTLGCVQVRAQLGNVSPLPWEDERMRSMIVNTVGEAYATVLLEALQRTASARPTMSALHDNWRGAQRKMRNDQDQSASDLL